MNVRQYAKRKGITIGAAYMRLWNNRVPGAELINGRWFIKPEAPELNSRKREKENVIATQAEGI